MNAGFDPAVVAVSIGTVFAGAFAAFQLTRRARARHLTPRLSWLLAAAAALATATWSADLLARAGADRLSLWPDGIAAALSLLLASLAAAAGTLIADRTIRRSLIGALVMGAGFAAAADLPAALTGPSPGFSLGAAAVSAGLRIAAASAILLACRPARSSAAGLAGAVLFALLATPTLAIPALATSTLHAFSAAPTAWLAVAAALLSLSLSALGLLAVLFDRRIEQMAQRETRLIRHNEEQLKRILEQVPFGVVVADTRSGAIVFSSRAADRALDELERGAPSFGHVFPTRDAVGDPLSRALRNEEAVDRELHEVRRRDGRIATFEISAAPIYDAADRSVLAIAAFQDVSARVKAEADLRQAQKMDALGQLTGGIAHDTNNLLTAILGNLDLLESRLVDTEQRQLLHNALVATERGAKLTGQLLGFSRRQSLQPARVDVNRAVGGMHALLTSTLGGTIAIRCDLDDDVWPALADPTQLELVLLNLTLNARDAMLGGGTITIATTNALLALPLGPTDPPPGEYVVLHVRDDGAGMAPETLSRVFEPFFTTKGGRGSGLGLPQVLGIAQQLGGGVRVTSELGRGTAVELYMPRCLSEAQPTRPDDPVPGPGQTLYGRTILLVDDDDDVRTAARALLGQLGCIVVEESSGGSAVARVAGPERLDLAIIDYAMPGLNGADTADQIRAIRPNLPVLVITGYADADQIPGVAGRYPTLQKPFRGASLAALLPTLLGPAAAGAPGTVPAQLYAFPKPRARDRDEACLHTGTSIHRDYF